ncbi:unnamed protein product [Symbiodinium pilosum]|uniref:Uncharacterized protein n=1 Tax=Symbiodinium pilosum TaxID=2952 RepID=A0A812TSM4_SYMPI|nr:unnamed protein product [Symbiodinium pilosum]
MASQLVPQKPSAPRARPQAPRRHVVLTTASQVQVQRPNSCPSIVPTFSETGRPVSVQSMPDLKKRRVTIQETPDIILFLALPEEATSRLLPPVRPLAAILEESTDSGSPSATLPRVEDAPPPPSLSPRLLPAGRAGLGGLRALVADREAATLAKLYHSF